jgi:hypothetical protein
MARKSALAAPLLVLVAACSGSSHPAASSSSAPGVTSAPSAGSTPTSGERQSNSAAAVSASPASSSSRAASAKPSGSPSAQPSPSDIPLNAALAKPCVVPGSTQTVTMHSRSAMSVIFDTLYPDQKDGQAYGGIDAHGRTDVAGSYTKTWTVSPAAPIGPAKVNLAAITDDGRATGHSILPFRISLTC